MAAIKTLSNAVLDAALGIVEACNKAQVVDISSGILIDNITLDAGNFGAIADNGSDGRLIECLISDGNDMKAINVDTGGAAKKIRLLLTAAVQVIAVMTSVVSLGSSDQVNLGTFNVILKDPT